MRDIKIKCFTWNVGNAEPSPGDLATWLPEPGAEESDVVAVGTQENSFSTKGGSHSATTTTGADGGDDEAEGEKAKLPENAKQSQREKDAKLWDSMVADRLGPSFTVVKHIVLWEMRLTVYAKKTYTKGLNKCISHIEAASSATGGPGGVFGNKGGLVIKFDFGPTSLAFISCHLAAHAPKLAQRNKNCQEILAETARSIGCPLVDAASQYDHVFWMGDLNYRVNLNAGKPSPIYPDEVAHHKAVLELIEKKAYDQLLAADQLNMCKAAGEAFAGFREGTMTFAPTFKVMRKVGTEYKDQRIPSYCDRVLWKSMPPLEDFLQQTSLISLPEVSTSDHKPVVATFAVRPSDQPFMEPEGSVAFTPPPRSSAVPTTRRTAVAAARAVCPLVRITSLEVSELVDMDIGGGSDPYCVFFTNPPHLLADDKNAPITAIKKAKSSMRSVKSQQVEAINHAEIALGDAAAPSPATEALWIRWSDAEVPILRPLMNDSSKLSTLTLIIAVMDHDDVSYDDPIGVALVPLAPSGAGPIPEEYEVAINHSLVRGNTAHRGKIRGTITVSFGSKLEAAEKAAKADGAGTKASSLSEKHSCCTLL